MIEINQNIFEIVLSGFNKLWTEKVDESKIDFKSHPIVVKSITPENLERN